MTAEYIKKHIFECPKKVLEKAIAIYLYGSVARNENDNDSDCDLFVCIDDCSEQDILMLKQAVLEWELGYNCEFAFYRLRTLMKMKEKGSYFLWHIKQEGILLYQRNDDFQRLLLELPRYSDTKSDFIEYSLILNDIYESSLQDSTTIEYDLSILAVVARNICIGCCYLFGEMDFGRRTPVKRCIDFWQGAFPFSLSEYDELYAFRLAGTRGKQTNSRLITKEYVQYWLTKLQLALSLAQTLVR